MRMPIFGGIAPEVLQLLVERAGLVDIANGDFFFREGSSGKSAFALENGRVSIHKQWDGVDYQLRELGPGDCFGEVALLDFGPRSASVRAERDCCAIELTARDLLSIAESHSEAFAMIYMNLGRELSRRLRQADERLFRAKREESPLARNYAFESN